VWIFPRGGINSVPIFNSECQRLALELVDDIFRVAKNVFLKTQPGGFLPLHALAM